MTPPQFADLLRWSQERCLVCDYVATGITARAKQDAIDDHVRYVNTQLIHVPNDPHFDEARLTDLVAR